MQLHFTPTYSSWLNHVELGFAKIERDILARGIFTSVANLKRKILKYVCRYNKTARLPTAAVCESSCKAISQRTWGCEWGAPGSRGTSDQEVVLLASATVGGCSQAKA